MSKNSIDIPTIEANAQDFQNLIHFIHKHEQLLKQFGGIKIKPHVECIPSLKKRRINSPRCSDVQKVIQISNNELIYSIKLETCKNQSSFDQSASINENSIWQSLSYSNDKKQQRSNLTIFPNKSFYPTRTHQNYFDIHRLPKLSLLKLGGSKILRNCVPSLIRAHGPGTIFPLASADHRLFSIDYHHEGGNRQWYIIPADERQKLELILKDQNSSICLEHKNLLINPSVFDKYHIQYHPVIQHPNEFVVLAAGALAQGFSENASWNETILFALPSWLQDGHANAQISPCNCCVNRASIPEPIDISQFRYELVQRWITKNLSLPINDKVLLCQEDHHKNIKTTIPIIPTDDEIEFLDGLDELTMDTPSIEPVSQNSQENTFLTEFLIPFSDQFLSELLTSPISNYSCNDEDENKASEKHSQVVQNNSMDSNQMIQSIDINQKSTSEVNSNERFTLFDLMEFLPDTSNNVESIQYQTNEHIDVYQNNKKQESNCSIMNSKHMNTKNIKNPKMKNQRKNIHNTLYVSGLRNEVSKKDLHRHFIGCKKVIMKRHQMPPYLKYAFVVHRTYSETEKNRRRSINYRFFGSECRVDYADQDFHARYEQQPCTIVVTGIPENVNENELRSIFIDCQSLKYCPGRTAYSMEGESTKKTDNKILPGYAFLQYSNSQQAANIVKNSAQYRINNQPLHVSFYTTKRTLLATRN